MDGYKPRDDYLNGRSLITIPTTILSKTKDEGWAVHNAMIEEMSTENGRLWAYSDASKSGKWGSIGMAWATADGVVVESNGSGCVDNLRIVVHELAAIDSVQSEGLN